MTSITCYSQDKFSFSQEGLKPDYIIISTDTLSAKYMHTKAVNWVKETYRKPELVFDSSIDGEVLRFTGRSAEGVFPIYNTFGEKTYFAMEYTIRLVFVDGKYKFEVKDYEIEHELFKGKKPEEVMYKENGKLITWYRDAPEFFPNYFDALNKSLYEYITGKSEEKW